MLGVRRADGQPMPRRSSRPSCAAQSGPSAAGACLPGRTRLSGDETLRRDAHAVVNRAFTEHFGETATSFERWAERMQAAATSDWGQLLVSYLDDRPVGMLLGNDQFVEDEHCGYVRTVGVVPEARGRGIARHLLRVAFARDAAAGREGTLLHVDTNNTTPALGLYESVGMRAVLVIDIWQRTLVTTTTSRPGVTWQGSPPCTCSRPSAGSVTATARVALRWPTGSVGEPVHAHAARSEVVGGQPGGQRRRGRSACRPRRRRRPGRAARGWSRRRCSPGRSPRRRRPRSGWCAPASRRRQPTTDGPPGRSSSVAADQPSSAASGHRHRRRGA